MARTIHLHTDLGERLHFVALIGEELLGEPYFYKLEVWCGGDLPDTDTLLGTPVAVSIQEEGMTRFIHGMVAAVEGHETRRFGIEAMHRLELTLVPRLWLLGQHRDCRIFSGLSVPDIVRTVLADLGFSDVRMQLEDQHPVRDYCVQYEESTLDFISRLMEQEGIYYFFEHAQAGHTLVLSDGLSAHHAAPGVGVLDCRNPEEVLASDRPGVCNWHARQRLRPTRWEQGGFDPLKPRAVQHVEARSAKGEDISGLSVYSAQGRHLTPDEGRRLAQLALQAQQCERLQWSGSTGCAQIGAGMLVDVRGCEALAGNGNFLMVWTRLAIREPSPGSSGGQGGTTMHCEVRALPASVPYRQPQRTSWPRIAGLQSAIVAGDRDEDIAVDAQGRVTVTFHWSTSSRQNGRVSCPVRVATPWAGKGWGVQSLPRVGQEVLVAFLDGDPDRPLIVGSVFNADHMPPFALPDNRTQSGIRSRSHPDGGNDEFNEIRFEDRKGAEELRLHAQRDLHVEAENDRTLVVGHDQTARVGNDQALTVEHDQQVTVRHDRRTAVDNEDTLEVGANAQARIGRRFRLEAGDQIELVTGASRIVMTSAGDIAIEGVNVRIAGNSSVEVEGGVEVKVKAGAMMDIGAGASLKMHSDATLQVQAGAMGEVKAPVLTLSGDALAKMAAAMITIG